MCGFLVRLSIQVSFSRGVGNSSDISLVFFVLARFSRNGSIKKLIYIECGQYNFPARYQNQKEQDYCIRRDIECNTFMNGFIYWERIISR